MKIAMVQLKPSVGDLASNETLMRQYVHEAYNQGVKLVCFPEMSLTGYDLTQNQIDIAKVRDCLENLRVLAEELDMTLLVGGMEEDDGIRYITQFVLQDTILTYRKIHICTKEQHHVARGESIQVFHCGELTFGIMICYDSHFPELASIMARMGAQVIFAPSASPNDPAKRVQMWEKYMVARAYDNRVTILATNLIFQQGGGGILGYNPTGECICSYSLSNNHMVVVDVEPKDFQDAGMRRRLFHKDRQPHIYEDAEKKLVKSWKDS